MLNVTFAGNLFDSLGASYSGDQVAYQAFYYTDNFSKWNDVRHSENGQYNINLGDGDWLTQQNNSVSYDNGKVFICFWTDNTKNRTDLDLTEWSFIEIDLNGSDVYQNDAQTMTAANPFCSFAYSGNISIENIGVTNDNEWFFGNIDHYQSIGRYNQIFFPIMEFPSDAVTIQWGDGDTEITDVLDYYDHDYTIPGDYHIIITVKNIFDLTCVAEMDVQSNAEVTNGLSWNIPSYLNNPITFVPSISGDIIQITDVSYDIDGIEVYNGLSYDENFIHTFNTVGPHTVTQKITVDNVYETGHFNNDYIVYLDSIANFYKDDGDCGSSFIDNSVVGNGTIKEYYWAAEFNNDIIAECTSNNPKWDYTWPYIGEFKIIHKITDGEDNIFGIERIYEVQSCPGSGGGESLGGYSTVYVEKDFPKLIVRKIDDINERKINISVKTKLL